MVESEQHQNSRKNKSPEISIGIKSALSRIIKNDFPQDNCDEVIIACYEL